MLDSVLASTTSLPSSRSLSAAICSMRSSSISAVTWLPNPCEAEWSVTARYSQSRLTASSAICSSFCAPPLAVWFERLAPVAQRRGAVQVPAQVAQLDELRQRAVARDLELAAALAQL